MDFVIKDVVEKEPSTVKAPSLPQPAAAGFPAPKKRVSAFKALRTGKPNSTPASDLSTTRDRQKPTAATQRTPVPTQNGFDIASEKRRIEEENNALLASMSATQIARERDELLDSLSPEFVQMLMKRANIDQEYDDDQTAVFDRLGSPSGKPSSMPQDPPEIKVEDTTAPKPQIATSKSKPIVPPAAAAPTTAPKDRGADRSKYEPGADDLAPETPVDIPFVLNKHHDHFTKPDDIPELDPSDPNFLESMQKKYFPNLSADPSQLAWMAPLPTENSPADRESPYYPGQSSLPISALRFDFRGRLLSPKKSREIPVTKGLHHHGEAPEAAGYTIGELAIYARSAVATQRCLAFQTLGRILYRLGKGDWGTTELARGIWATAMEGRVMDTLWEAANKEGGHLSSQAYAAEALWLFEQGGWKEKYQGR